MVWSGGGGYDLRELTEEIIVKKLSVAILAASAAILSGCDNGAFKTPTTNQLVNPDHNYEIDTWGANSEVYEFTPKSNTSKSCVMLMLDNSRAMGLQCFDKPSASGEQQ